MCVCVYCHIIAQAGVIDSVTVLPRVTGKETRLHVGADISVHLECSL